MCSQKYVSLTREANRHLRPVTVDTNDEPVFPQTFEIIHSVASLYCLLYFCELKGESERVLCPIEYRSR